MQPDLCLRILRSSNQTDLAEKYLLEKIRLGDNLDKFYDEKVQKQQYRE